MFGSLLITRWPLSWCQRLAAPILLAALVGLPLTGCQQSRGGSPGALADTTGANGQPENAAAELPAFEAWETTFMGGSRVGYTHTVWRETKIDGKTFLESDSTSQLTLKRFGQVVQQTIHLTDVTDKAGRLVSFTSEIRSSDAPVTAQGEVKDGKLRIVVRTQANTQTQTIDWPDGGGGFHAAQWSLREKPLADGETRNLVALMPLLNSPGKIRLKAVGKESVDVLGQTHELMKMEGESQLGSHQLKSVIWADAEGTVQRQRVLGIGQEIYRTSREFAIRPITDGGFDLGESSLVRLSKPIRRHTETAQVIYLAHLPKADPASLFPESATQKVERIDKDTARITVFAQPRGLAPGAAKLKPSEQDLASNSLIQSDDPKVTKMAAAVLPGVADPSKLAIGLRDHVNRAIRKKDFSKAFATAAEVAANLEGDCTEHSVLLAALCRARGIPARVAIGLVYFAPSQGFAYHMWNEVLVDGVWVPLDATLGAVKPGAIHLKLAGSHLSGADAYSAFMPVVSVMGQLKLEVAEIRYAD